MAGLLTKVRVAVMTNTQGCGPHCGHWKDVQELEQLRALISAWIDAKDWMRQSPPSDLTNDLAAAEAEDELRKAVGR